MRRPAASLIGAFFALVVICSTSVWAASPVQAATPDGFIRAVADKAFASLGENGITEDERSKRFRSLLNEAFDLPRIARFVLGRYWRTATDSEKTEFVSLFEKFVIQAYANRFRDLTGKKLLVQQAKQIDDSNTLVVSEIEIPGQPSVKINWRVDKGDGGFKIVDVMVEGISMSVTQRDEFAAVIRQSSGKVSGLIDALRRKTSESN